MAELHFTREEHENRIARARQALRARGLDALLMFAQESHFYLTGYDTAGYVFFQCAVLTADDQPITLLTRRPDVQQAHETSIIPDVRVWYDAEGVDPALDLRDILAEKGLEGARVGIELNTFGLTGASHDRVRRALDGWCALEDASDIVRGLRLVKSPAELNYVRGAARLADDALVAMIDASRPGTLDTAICAAGLDAMLRGGGDVPPGGPLVNSGRRALYGRSVAGPHTIEEFDQVTIEFATSYHRYTACIDAHSSGRQGLAAAARHVCAGQGRDHGDDRGRRAGPTDRLDRRRPPAGVRPGRPRSQSICRLRLCTRRDIPADVDGRAADDLFWQPADRRAGHGVLSRRDARRR